MVNTLSVADLQRALQADAFASGIRAIDPGVVDGVAGERTNNAIVAWWAAHVVAVRGSGYALDAAGFRTDNVEALAELVHAVTEWHAWSSADRREVERFLGHFLLPVRSSPGSTGTSTSPLPALTSTAGGGVPTWLLILGGVGVVAGVGYALWKYT